MAGKECPPFCSLNRRGGSLPLPPFVSIDSRGSPSQESRLFLRGQDEHKRKQGERRLRFLSPCFLFSRRAAAYPRYFSRHTN